MSAKAAAYHAQVKNSMITRTKTGLMTRQKRKLDRIAEKNTSNGILARNKLALLKG